ncbi:hypothetical protein GTS_02360 [Gandjariella thermophila]|uniref:HTH luxR-type domain-containing protein n=1 Tax=Gandjariella thermophila TaxID=1931992 RepID=A0A4D4J3Q3_9PSEU|nr:hypothetical protein GTS_02360 [Gandjariella thermophila]
MPGDGRGTAGGREQHGVANRVVGRVAELAEVDAALAEVQAGSQRVVEFVGEPGMGKTALLDALRARAERRGFVVLDGQAMEFERLPFAVFVDALDDYLGTVDPGKLAALGEHRLGLLSTVFPALGGGTDRPDLAAAERHLLYRAVRALLESIHDGATLLLVLDDLHWVDEGSAELLDHLLRHPPTVPLLVALAYRPRQLPDRLATTLARCSGDGWWRRIEVGPLSPAEVDEVCAAEVPPGRRRQLYEASGGNPFYLDALLRTGPARQPDAFGDRDVRDHELPQAVRAALLGELSGLSDSVRLVARAAAVLGEVFDAGLVAPVAQTDETDVLVALDELLARDLVRPTASTQRFRFRHPLLRSVVYGSAGAGWRLGAHARASALLAERGASLPVQAIHVERAAGIGDEGAVDVLVRAAWQVCALAPARAAHWLRQALRLLGDRANARPELWMRLAHTLAVAGQLQESHDILHQVLDLLPPGPDGQRLEAVTSLAMVQRLLGRHGSAKVLLLAELDALGPRRTSATAGLELELAAGALRGSDFPAAVRWGARALASAASDTQPRLVATATALLALAGVFAGSTAEAVAKLDEAVRMVDDAPDRLLATHLDAILRVGWTEVFLERLDEARRHLGRALDLARSTGQSYVLADVLVGLAYAYLWSGRLAEAACHADDAIEAALLVGSDELRTMAGAVGVAVALSGGDLPSALRAAEKTVAEAGTAAGRGPTIAAGMLAQARLLNGDADAARETLLHAGGGDDLPRFEFPTRASWFRTLTQAELARGEMIGAARWVRRAEAAAAVTGLSGQQGHALLARAAFLLANKEAAGAATAAGEAAAAFAAVGMRLYQAHAHMAAADALVTTGDRAGALSRFGQAKALFAAAGADTMRRHADTRLRALGGRAGRSSLQGRAALSDRERQIAELVAQGRTNRQIADQLFVSPKTVEAHLSRTFTKLGVSSRAALASAIAAERSPAPEESRDSHHD